MSQTERLLYIDRHLRDRRPVKAFEVARHFETSDRTIKRDIEYMRDRLNAPILYDAETHSYKYEKTFDVLKFADERILLLYCLIRGLVDDQTQVPIVSDEIIAHVGNHVSTRYRPLAEKIHFEHPVHESVEPEHFVSICKALTEEKELEGTYVDGKGQTSERSLEAERLVNYSGRWYLVAWDKGREALRTFQLSRFTGLKTGMTVRVSDRKTLVDDYLSKGFGIWRQNSANPITVTIRFFGDAASTVAAQVWPPAQTDRAQILADGTLILDRSLKVSGYPEILGRVLSFGALAEVREPPEFRALWTDAIRGMAERAGIRLVDEGHADEGHSEGQR